MVCMHATFHENDRNHQNDENDEAELDSYKKGVECWDNGNHGNRGNQEMTKTSAKWPCKGAMWIFWPDFWVEFWTVNFGRWISRRWIFQGASFPGKNRTKKFDPRIRVRNSGVQYSFSRIRAQIRVSEVQNPLCKNLSLRKLRESGVETTDSLSTPDSLVKGNRAHNPQRFKVTEKWPWSTWK